jgi:hypothetical protein
LDVNNITGSSLNLSSYTVASQLRKSYYSLTANSFNASISNAANGEITLTMSAATTANLKSGRYVYDVVITDSSNNKTRLIEGIATVLPSVTR